MQQLSRRRIAAIAFAALSIIDIASARETFKLIRVESDIAAGTSGKYFNTFSNAIINNNDDLAYRSVLQNGSGVSTANNDGIWTDHRDIPAKHILIARERQGLPGSGLATFNGQVTVSVFQTNDFDILSMRAQLTGSGVTNANDFGIWTTATGPLTLVAREGDPAPGTDGIFSEIRFPALTNSATGDLYFKARISGGTVTGSTDSTIYGYVGNTLTLIHREGDATPVLTVGSGGPGTPAQFGEFGEVGVSDNGQLIYSATIIGGVAGDFNTGLFTDSGMTTSLLIQENAFMPDAAGAATPAILSTFSSYAINDSGEYIVKATLRPGFGGVTNLNNEALLTNTGGTLRLLGREGDLTPEGGDTFSSFPTFFIGNSGATCFSSNLIGNKSSIYSTVSGGAPTLIAKEGAAAAGTDSTYLNLLNPAMNHSGQILYTSTLVITGMTNSTNNAGLWRTSAPATPPTANELLSCKGDTEDNLCGIITAYDLHAPGQNGTGGVAGVGRSINDNDNLVIAITTSGTLLGSAEGVYVLGDDPPVFCDVPQDIFVNIPVGGGPIAIDWMPPVAVDDKGIVSVVSSHNPGDSFYPGVTIISYLATDTTGQETEFRFRIVVTEIRDVNKLVEPDFVTLKGDAAPGADTFSIFNRVCVNQNDEIAMVASTTSGLAGIWSNAGGSLTDLALEGDPFTGALTLGGVFSDLRITPDGRTGFTASVAGMGVTSDSNSALLAEDSGASMALAAYESDVAPGAGGGVYRQMEPPAYSQSPTSNFLYYSARLLTGGVITGSNDTGIWFSDPDGPGAVLKIREGDPIAALPGLFFGNVTPRVVTGGDNGDYVFTTTLTGTGTSGLNNVAMWASTIAGSPELLLRRGDAAAGPNVGPSTSSSQWKKPIDTVSKLERRDNGSFHLFESESISPDGANIAFRAILQPKNRVTSTNNTGVWLIDGNRNQSLIAREGHQAPGFADGVCFERFDGVVVNDDAEVSFRAWLKHDTMLGIDSSNDCGIWTNSGGFLRYLMHEGQLAPNTDGSIVLRIDSIAGHQGGLATILTLEAGQGDAVFANNLVLATGSDVLTGLFQINLREGDEFDDAGSTRTLNFLGIEEPFNSVGGSGGYCNSADGSIDRVVLKATFSGGGAGVISSDLSNVGP